MILDCVNQQPQGLKLLVKMDKWLFKNRSPLDLDQDGQVEISFLPLALLVYYSGLWFKTLSRTVESDGKESDSDFGNVLLLILPSFFLFLFLFETE